MLRRRKYESRRGFTLVELVVVLVILAILTSVAVPAFSHQIDDAKEKKAVTEAQACVTAATGLTAQKYTEARTAYIQDSSKEIAVTLANWAGKVQDARPTITGTLAQREGTGEYLLAPQGTPDGSAAGAAAVKAAAGVDGTVLNFWCNTNGQIVYLLYKSADDILVAYANDANSGSNGIVIPTANVPTPVPTNTPIPTAAPTPTTTPTVTVTPTTTPTTDPDTPATPDPGKSEGNLIIHIVDAVTGKGIPGISLTVKGAAYSAVVNYSHTLDKTDDGGYAYVAVVPQSDMPANPDALGQYYSYRVVLTNAVSGYQDFLETKFTCGLIGKTVTAWPNNYANGESASENILTIPLYPVASITLKKTDTNNQPLANAFFTITSEDGNQSVTVKSTASGEVSIPVKLHALDGTGANALDITSGGTFIYNVKEITPPSGYVAHDDFEFKLNVNDINAAHDFEFHWAGNTPAGVSHTTETPSAANSSYSLVGYSVHTLTVENEAAVPCSVTITKLDSKDAEQGVSGAELVLYNEENQQIGSWKTTATQNSKTFSLLPGSYTLHESKVPSKYLQAADISFTIKDGETSREIKMFDPTIDTGQTDSPIASKDYNVVFKAENWANKLAYDGEKNSSWTLKLKKEVLLWKGELYYDYTELFGIPNPQQDTYKKYFDANGVMPSDALDPIAHIDKYVPAAQGPGSSYVVKLTGKVCSWKEGTNLFNKGDVLIANTGKKYKAFVYLGNDGSTVTLPVAFTDGDALAKLGFSLVNENYVTITPIN